MTVDSPFDAKFDKKVEDLLAHFHVPGLSLSVIKGPETFAKGYGFAQLPDTPATADTLFYAGSTGKAFTAAAASLLVDNHTELEWDTPLAELMRDEFVLPDTYATTHITLEDALSHRSGMPGHDLTYQVNDTPADVVRRLRHLPMTAEIRTTFQYCNTMYTAVGYLIEKLSGLTLGDFWEQRIWVPLGMDSSYSSLNDAKSSRKPMAKGYHWDNDTQAYRVDPYTPMNAIGGAGAVISTVNDYCKWLRMMVTRSPPLSKRGHESLMQPRSFIDAGFVGGTAEVIASDPTYALGWEKHVYRDQVIVSHEGSITGFGALAMYLPGLDWGITVFANTQHTSDGPAKAVAFYLIDEMLGTPEGQRHDIVRIYDEQTRNAERSHDTALKRLYPEVPDPPIPLVLPLEAYCGPFHHEAYGELEFSINRGDDTLRYRGAELALLPHTIKLEHVTGEHWLATVAHACTGVTIWKVRAESRINAQGLVGEFGIEIDSKSAALGRKIWFSKMTN